MSKPILTLLFLLFFGIGMYAQPKVVGEPRVIAKTSEPLEKPVWSSNGKTLYFTSVNDGARWEVSHKGKKLKKSSARKAVQPIVKTNANQLLKQMVDEPQKVASQVKGLESLSGYILFNPVLSPKGDQIVFQVGKGKGMFVCNADGSNLRSLGKGGRATWMPDGKFIVVTMTEDDGHTITKSELIVINVATGDQTKLLSSDKLIAYNPTISPNGKKIAFEDFTDGTIYVMDIQ